MPKKCSICRLPGHNRRGCKQNSTLDSNSNIISTIEKNIDELTLSFAKLTISTGNESQSLQVENAQNIVTQKQGEVQAHGFKWEREVLLNIYGATEEELEDKKYKKYTSKHDLPKELNRLDEQKYHISVKTSKEPQTVCMADCFRVYEVSGNDTPIHMVVINYEQNEITNIKKITRIIEVDLTNSKNILFNNITLEQIKIYNAAIKAIPNGRYPTKEEKQNLDALQKSLNDATGAIIFNPKIDSKKQRRLQCSFNKFNEFISQNPDRVIAKSENHEFRGGMITPDIYSPPRVFKKKETTEPIQPMNV